MCVALLKVLSLSGSTSDLAGQGALAGSPVGRDQQLTAQNLSWQVYRQTSEICSLKALQRAQQAQELPLHTG